MHKLFVLGFIFNQTQDRVLLIHKNRPDWQVGRLNGLGGKVEAGESLTAAIAREIEEEAGLHIPETGWHRFAELVGPTEHVTVFTSVWPNAESLASSMTDEVVEWFEIDQLPAKVHSNLRWLIPLALDVLTHPSLDTVTAHYTT